MPIRVPSNADKKCKATRRDPARWAHPQDFGSGLGAVPKGLAPFVAAVTHSPSALPRGQGHPDSQAAGAEVRRRQGEVRHRQKAREPTLQALQHSLACGADRTGDGSRCAFLAAKTQEKAREAAAETEKARVGSKDDSDIACNRGNAGYDRHHVSNQMPSSGNYDFQH